MITVRDLFILESKKRLCKTEKEFDKLIELEKLYKRDTNYDYLLREAKNLRQRKYRLNKYTKKLLDKQCLFLTITLRTEIPEDAFISAIKTYFKNMSLKGYFNLDYGGKNGRLHAHAIVQCDYLDNSLKNDLRWDLGALNVKKIVSSDDYLKISHYISKLTNHAVKSSAVGRVIYFNFTK